MGSRPPPARQAEAIVRSYLNTLRPGAVCTGRDPSPDLWELVLCVIQQAWLPRLMSGGGGSAKRPHVDDRLDIMATLDHVDSMPPIWVIHGEQDSVVGLFES
jgi:hypothetical protein